jgi:hypothetical protein
MAVEETLWRAVAQVVSVGGRQAAVVDRRSPGGCRRPGGTLRAGGNNKSIQDERPDERAAMTPIGKVTTNGRRNGPPTSAADARSNRRTRHSISCPHNWGGAARCERKELSTRGRRQISIYIYYYFIYIFIYFFSLWSFQDVSRTQSLRTCHPSSSFAAPIQSIRSVAFRRSNSNLNLFLSLNLNLKVDSDALGWRRSLGQRDRIASQPPIIRPFWAWRRPWSSHFYYTRRLGGCRTAPSSRPDCRRGACRSGSYR